MRRRLAAQGSSPAPVAAQGFSPVFCVAWLLLFMSSSARAQQAAPAASSAEPSVFSLRASLKASGLFSHAPEAPAIYADRNTATGFGRVRLEPTVRLSDSVMAGGAYEQRLRWYSAPAGIGSLGVLPAETPAPYRLAQLDWQIARSPHGSWWHEIDRAYVQARLGRANLTAGRQAIGWGRGVLFGAVDLFSPFSPLEADREWRRGVDALRADVKLTDRASFDAVGAFAPRLDDSIMAGRLRGYAGKADLEVVGGWRARDVFGGVTSSSAIGDAEVHGELAFFHVPESSAVPAGAGGDGRTLVVKAVAGASYRFPLGNGVLTWVEYHYSGFGAARAQNIVPLLLTPEFRVRYLRGDTQILGRHALAALASYEASPELSFAAQWLLSPRDGSGVAAPSVTWTFSDSVSLLATSYVPYGRPPEGLSLQSEYGAGALSAFVQLRVYR